MTTTTTTTTTMTMTYFNASVGLLFSKDCFATFCQNKTEQNTKGSFSKNKQRTKRRQLKVFNWTRHLLSKGEKWFFWNSAALSSLIPLFRASRWVRISVSNVRLSNLFLRVFSFFSHRQMLPWCDLNQELIVFCPTWIWWFKSSTFFFILHFMIFIKNIKVNCNICR